MKLDFEYAVIDYLPGFQLGELAERRFVEVSADLQGACLAHGKAADNLDQLFSGRALCVTTGQQPGLVTGPLYTIYKALSAIALAGVAERRLNRPVVPVFWVAGDDHDFAESNHLHLLTVANTIERVTLRARDPQGPLLPMYREPVGDDIRAVLDSLVRATPDTEYKPGILDWIGRHYEPDANLASAFAGALAELLGERGLVVFQPTHVAAKQASIPLLLQALEQAGSLDRSLQSWAEHLRSEGRPTPIKVGNGATTAMIESSLGRDRLVLDGNEHYKARRSGERWTLDEVRQVAEAEPQRLSANVLLRPVVEAALLPTLVYVGGPGELAYLPQAKPLYEGLGVSPQAATARWSARVVEGRIAKVLDKYGVTADDLAAAPGQLEANLVKGQLPQEATLAVASIRDVLDHDYERLALAAAGIDATLQKPVRAARQNALRSLAGVEKRLIAQLKKQNEIIVQQLTKARLSLTPLGKQQERVFNVVPYLMRYGAAFLDRAAECCERWAEPLETRGSHT
ncbi:MAG: bacillithiol biosynthesis cysteine-adding enzyme BshC [Gemmatimonadota bacterium]|nr:MAG: bacillithiol biosynthesis cysteine-adding enzyme BshC [Gemmatimonadota bacterium]